MGDKRIVMTLDAGGTNFVFGAVRDNHEVAEPIVLRANGDNLDLCLKTIIKGFEEIRSMLDAEPAAISFAFPGPADYTGGIIGDLGNLPAFRGGVALGPMLENRFNVPVFINNDGDLFTYGEAIAGFLPWVNEQLKQAGSKKRFRNLIGVTLGTGFGGGLARDGELVTGDNAAAGEIWLLRIRTNPGCFAEESISIRAVLNSYKKIAGNRPDNDLTPLDIYEIAAGKKQGNRSAAIESYEEFGDALGDALASIITVFDGLVVVGGGLSKAWEFFASSMTAHLNGSILTTSGDKVPRTEVAAFNLQDSKQMKNFISGGQKEITIPFSKDKILYDPLKRTGIGLSRLGTSRAVSIGAYAFALNAIDKEQ